LKVNEHKTTENKDIFPVLD